MMNLEVIQVGVGQYQTILAFTHDISLQISFAFRLIRPGEFAIEGDAELPSLDDESLEKVQSLCRLLGQQIINLAINEEGELEITFSKGSMLVLFDDDPHYECYVIAGPTQLIVV